MPDWTEQIDSSLIDLVRHVGVRRVEMANVSIGVSREDRDRRMLVAVLVFAREVGLKRIVATTQEPKRAPTSQATVFAQSGGIGRGRDREVHVLSEMMSHAVKTVDPHRTHRARFLLPLSVHEMVNNQRAIRRRQKLRQAHLVHRLIASRVELIGGGYYYWNNGYWYPAWGYSPSAEYYAYDGPIYVGHRAEPPDQVIADVQAELQQMGYYRGEVDGLLGPLTRQALTAYQADQGLTTTAVIDEPTLDSLGLA
jgi:hypothetical protein